MTKEEIQTRILQNGKSLNLNKFSWDEKTKTFSTLENNLVLDFKNINNCTFRTGSYCTFDTGYNCTFDTGSSCTFKTYFNCTFNTGSDCIFGTDNGCIFKTGEKCIFNTGSNCTFNTESFCSFNTGSYCTFMTGYNCTFKTGLYCTFKTGLYCTFKTGSNCTFNTGHNCVIIRGDIFEIIILNEKKNYIKTLPYGIKGYITKLEDEKYYHYPNENDRIEIIDGIVSKVVSQKGNVLKVINHGETGESYIVTDGEFYAHGNTIKEAKESLIYKITTRDLSEFESWNLEDIKTKEELIKAYRSITGSCESMTRKFVEDNDIKDKLTVKEAIEITKGRHEWNKFNDFFYKKEKVEP